MNRHSYRVIVVGGGHAGVEAAWAAANLLPCEGEGARRIPSVALITLDPARIGVMSCNPAIGGLAKGQMVREIDALGGLMGLATDATGIQFKVLNASKGPAVRGPRAQCDKHAYAETVRGMIDSREEIEIIAGSVERLIVERGQVKGAIVTGADGKVLELRSHALVLTTGTFMRGLMHTGDRRMSGGRHGEGAAVGISAALQELGFELGRLKTGTPPRLRRGSIAWDQLETAQGDQKLTCFSDLSGLGVKHATEPGLIERCPSLGRFPVADQVDCRVTRTTPEAHDLIRANLHRAPMFSGQIEGAGPRYCPSIEDKVVRFADRDSHHVFLEPESLRDDWVYCNGISTSLPEDVQEVVVRSMPGCERAEILRYGYAVEYDVVRPHQIDATCMTKEVGGLFLAGQINGTSGYEEAAAQGLLAGINAAKHGTGQSLVTLGRDQAYIGVLMDDLVTKTPIEPYRMFTSRAEHRLVLRADNAADRLTPMAQEIGLLDSTPLGRLRRNVFARRRECIVTLSRLIDLARVDGIPFSDLLRRPEFTLDDFESMIRRLDPSIAIDQAALLTVHTEHFYTPYIQRQHAEIRRHADLDHRTIPDCFDPALVPSLRTEAREAIRRFRPRTLGQASRLEGITPADITLLSVAVRRVGRPAEPATAGTPG